MFDALPGGLCDFPLERGLYEVVPGLKKLSLETNPIRRTFFILNQKFQTYRSNKISARRERLSKYIQVHEFSDDIRHAVYRWIIETLCHDFPDYFSVTFDGSDLMLHCALTGEVLCFDRNTFEYVSSRSLVSIDPPYQDAWDALGCQVQEDLAVVSRSQAGDQPQNLPKDRPQDPPLDWLSALHLCAPSHWGAEEKIGGNFHDVHKPVPGIQLILDQSSKFVDAMITKSPMTRGVWGFGSDDRLNHHPVAPHGIDVTEWTGRKFNMNRKPSPFVLRIERQAIWGLPQVNAALFSIHVYFIEGCNIRSNPIWRDLAIHAVESMSKASLKYKGLDQSKDAVLNYLRTT